MDSFRRTLRTYHKGDCSLEQLSYEIDCLLKDEHVGATELLAMLRDGNIEHLLPANLMEFISQGIETDDRHDVRGKYAPRPGDDTVVDDGITDDVPEDDSVVDLELRNNHRGIPWEKVVRALPRRSSNKKTTPDNVGTHHIKQVGDQLNERFELTQYLGSGGMHRVFKARDLSKRGNGDLNNVVAIKVIDPRLCEQPEWRDLVKANTLQCKRLSHPNVAETYDFFEDGLTLYTSTEYVAGKSLRKIIDAPKFKGMPLNKALRIINGMGSALACAHAHGIVHCDFKPTNVILTDEGIAKVIDFGIARALYLDEQADLQPLYKGALTPAYASPERLEHHKPDPSDDVYSLACTCYELLTGVHPFGRSRATGARKFGIQPERALALNRRQWGALQKALDFDRASRTSTVEEFLAGINGRDNRWRSAMYATSGLGVIAAITWFGTHHVMVREAAGPVVQQEVSTISSRLASANGPITNPRAAPTVLAPDADRRSEVSDKYASALKSEVIDREEIPRQDNRTTPHSITSLLISARSGDLNTLVANLAAGILPNAREPVSGSTALITAARNGHVAVITALIQAGADVNAKDVQNKTALLWAAQRGHTETVQILLDSGADKADMTLQGDNALTLAAWDSHAPVVRILLSMGINVNFQNSDGWTALIISAINGFTSLSDLLLAQGADPNILSNDGQTALMAAAWNGHAGIVKRLCASGCVANARGQDGRTALHQAAWNGHRTIVRMLVGAGADVSIKNYEGQTAEMVAANQGHAEIGKLLKVASKDK